MLRHRNSLKDLEETQIVSEDNEEMLGTYAMIDPQGRAYTNLHGRYSYSKQSAVDIGYSAAWKQVMGGFSHKGFINRGGEWSWDNNGNRIPLPVVED